MKIWATVVAIWIPVLLFFVPAGAHGSLHKDSWKAPTLSGTSFSCESVTSQSRLEDVLEEAGWDQKRNPYPKIDWNTQEAVVVAPEKYPSSGVMEFNRLYYDGNTLILQYSWQLPRSSGKSTSSTTLVSKDSSPRRSIEPSTIVVSFEKNIRKGYAFVCEPSSTSAQRF